MSVPTARDARGRIVVAAAMSEEIRPLIGRMTVERREAHAGRCRVVLGTIDGQPIAAVRTGDGPLDAAAGLESVLAGHATTRVVVIGIAGGLSPDLSPGERIVAGEVRDDRGPVPSPDPRWLAAVRGLNLGRQGTVLSSRRVLRSPEDKRDAWSAIDRVEPAVVDLESAAMARICTARGVPFLVVRAVSDTAEEALPLDLERFRDVRGRLSRPRIAAWAVPVPRRIAALWRLRNRTARCARALAEFVAAAVRVAPIETAE